MPEISVIVPVYNVEEYLVPCLNSILEQTFTNFELILVDDGSPDSCGSICDEYAEKDNRVKVIHQKNQGLSGARNSGMDVAVGKYITFIDSDDLVNRFYLDVLFHYATEECADVAGCPLMEFVDSKELPPEYDFQKVNVRGVCLSNIDACVRLYDGYQDIPVNACGKLFSAELIKDLRFPVGRLHEDQAIIPIACYHAEKVVAVLCKMYYYRTRPVSITKDVFSIKRYDDIWAIDQCITYFESKGEGSILEAARRRRKRLMAVYSIYAKRDAVPVPNQYRTNIIMSLIYLRRNVNPQRYQYYLSQLYPKLVIFDEYFRKLEKCVKRNKRG